MDIRFAKETTHVAAGTGHTVLVILGTHWPADDPIVQAFPNLFPGQKRVTARPPRSSGDDK